MSHAGQATKRKTNGTHLRVEAALASSMPDSGETHTPDVKGVLLLTRTRFGRSANSASIADAPGTARTTSNRIASLSSKMSVAPLCRRSDRQGNGTQDIR